MILQVHCGYCLPCTSAAFTTNCARSPRLEARRSQGARVERSASWGLALVVDALPDFVFVCGGAATSAIHDFALVDILALSTIANESRVAHTFEGADCIAALGVL